MVFEEVLDKINILPICVKNDKDVLPILKKTLDDYTKYIDTLVDFSYSEKVKEINKHILRTFEYYYNGMTNKAYEHIKKIFTEEDIKNLININTMEKIGYENEHMQLFRARVGEDVYELTDIFHNPFNNRHLIPTYRYSIPGFPCLYLSGSIHGCWLEMNKPSINKMFVSRFEANAEMKILDLATLPQDIKELDIDKNKYIITWPIICACSISVKDSNRTFKSEYIIPQLVLQVMRELNFIDGIRYFSVKADYKKVKCNPVYINYVFISDISETINIQENIYSKNLISNFRVTPPLNIAIFNSLNAIGKSTIEVTALNKKMNRSIESNYYRHNAEIEVAKGYFVEYSGGDFYNLEKVLCKIPAEQIVNLGE